MRAALNGLYRVTEALGATCLALIALLILANIATRLARAVVPGLDEFAMYVMAASFFLLLGPALRKGSHIRVTILLDRLGRGPRRAMELLCLGMATALSAYFAYWWVAMAWDSWDFGDVSQGVVPIPLWVPQATMGYGLVVLVIALTECLFDVIRGRRAVYEDAGMASEG